MSPRALVTGAAGFIGRSLADRLQSEGWEVEGLDREHAGAPALAAFHALDLSDYEGVRAAVESSRPDVVFHLAASRDRSRGVAAYRTAIETNLFGTLGIAEALIAADGGARLVAVGTAEEYGAARCPYREDTAELPVSAYSFSKLAATQLLEVLARMEGLRATVLRPSIAYGPGQGPDMFVAALVSALVSGHEFPMTAGEQTRDFVYVDDLVDALVAAALAENAVGRVVNIGSGEQVSIRRVAELAEQLAGTSDLVRPGTVPYRAGEQMSYCVDPTLAAELLGWRARTPLEEGLRRTIDAARLGA